MSENIDSINIKSSSLNLDYTNIELDGDIPLCLADDREAASKAISLVIAGTRRGFVSLCTDVASLLRSKRRLELKVDRLKKEVLFLRGSPDLRSTSSSYVSQLSLSDRESLTESLQLRIINHVLKDHVDDLKIDKSSPLKMPTNKTNNLPLTKNSKNFIIATNDQISPTDLYSIEDSFIKTNETENRTTLINMILPNEKNIPDNNCQNGLDILEENSENASPTADGDLRVIEANLKKVILENKFYIKEMLSMKTLIIELQNELKGFKDAELLKRQNYISTKSNHCTVDIDDSELIEMQILKNVKKIEDSGLDSTSSENSLNPLKLSSVPTLANKPRALHRSKALPRVINKKL